MPFTDSDLRALKPQAKQFRVATGNGLFVVVYPNGSKYFVWGYRSATTSDREAFKHFTYQGGRLIGFRDMPTLGIFALMILQSINASTIL